MAKLKKKSEVLLLTSTRNKHSSVSVHKWKPEDTGAAGKRSVLAQGNAADVKGNHVIF